MGAAGRWFVTPHAVARYREIRPRLGYRAALADLIRISEVARRVKPLHDGVALYRGPKPMRLRCYVQERGPGLPQLLTVIQGPR